MATFITVDYEKARLLELNKLQVDANRLRAEEALELQRLARRAEEINGNKETVTPGRPLRRGRREELAAFPRRKVEVIDEVSPVSYGYRKGWRKYSGNDPLNIIEDYLYNSYEGGFTDEVFVNTSLVRSSANGIFEGYYIFNPTETEKTNLRGKYYLGDLPGDPIPYAIIRYSNIPYYIDLLTGSPIITSTFTETGTAKIQSQTRLGQKQLTLTDVAPSMLSPPVTDMPTLPLRGQELRAGAHSYIIADATQIDALTYRIKFNYLDNQNFGMQEVLPASTTVSYGYTAVFTNEQNRVALLQRPSGSIVSILAGPGPL